MKRCPKCNEVNGDGRTTCWKCGAEFEREPVIAAEKMLCPKCGQIYLPQVEICTSCGTRLVAYTEKEAGKIAAAEAENEGKAWMYIVAFLIPIAGLIMGCVYLSQNRIRLGKSVISTSVAAIIVALLFKLLVS